MQSKMKSVIVAAGMASALLVVGIGLMVAWQTLVPPAAGLPGRDRNNIPQIVRNDLFDFPGEFPGQQEEKIPDEQLPKAGESFTSAKDLKVSGPIGHKNLTVFLILGNDTLKQQEILTLQEALEQNVAVVHETGTGQLAIDNRGNLPLFIQSGDIVKGGTQDRTLPSDLLVPAQTTRMPLIALCVEKGRSFPRGNEVSTSFQTATEQLPGKSLKMAAYRQDQNAVWNNVQALQANLTRNVGASVQSAQSLTSLQLTLENDRVREAIEEYSAKLAAAPVGKTDVVGFAVAVNGKIQTADVYGSSALFMKRWPKLIKASAVDALAQLQNDAKFDAPTAESVRKFLADAEQGQAFRRQVSLRTTVIRHESGQALLFDACDPTRNNLVMHRSFLTK